MLEMLVDFKELRMMYTCAIKEVKTKFEVLDTEFKVRYRRNPISDIESRLKSNQSILEKMERRHIPFSLENVEKNINDIAGIRVICSYIDDIYLLADALSAQDDIKILEVKDYIKNPKPNGYRSYHMIVSVPVFFAENRRNMKVEVQIRTIAMDFWASLEHQMKYKKEIPDQGEISARLQHCANGIAAIDQEMLALREKIEAAEDKPTEEDILVEKLMKIDVPLY
ncbi:MAG: GTP pyrophosphokinase family protein [Lachnospiraceae bacterium]|nr:GTP pyrophosphokinase family protein [Lachnospiraceae bacterium]